MDLNIYSAYNREVFKHEDWWESTQVQEEFYARKFWDLVETFLAHMIMFLGFVSCAISISLGKQMKILENYFWSMIGNFMPIYIGIFLSWRCVLFDTDYYR